MNFDTNYEVGSLVVALVLKMLIAHSKLRFSGTVGGWAKDNLIREFVILTTGRTCFARFFACFDFAKHLSVGPTSILLSFRASQA